MKLCTARTSRVALIAGALFCTLLASAAEVPPYVVVDGKVDRSTFLGWRVFHSACYGCHGVDALGTSVGPDLTERVKALSASDFVTKVLTRYRVTVSADEASMAEGQAARDALLAEVMKRERGEVVMPAWEPDPNVKPHVLDLYAYLRARADGVLGRGRPPQQVEGK